MKQLRNKIPIGEYRSITKWGRLLANMKRLMDGPIPNVNQAASCAVGVPFTYQRGAPMAWLRNEFNAPSLKGVWTKDGKRL